MATMANFYVLKDFQKEMLFSNLFWMGLYPNSIAVMDEQNVFVGMRGGITQLDLVAKKLKFYKY